MKIFENLLVLCLLVLLVGCGNLPEKPPLSDEAPIALVRVQPEEIDLKSISKEFDSYVKYFSGNPEVIERVWECVNPGGEGGLFPRIVSDTLNRLKKNDVRNLFPRNVSDTLNKLKKNEVRNLFYVVEKDAYDDDRNAFFAIDVYGLNKKQIDSVSGSLESCRSDCEATVYAGDGYLVTNLEGENEDLEDKFSGDELDEWPEDILKGLKEYQNCPISVCGVFPSKFYKRLQHSVDELSGKEYYAFKRAAQKSLKDLKKVDFYAAGVDFKTQTLSVSLFMESSEDAEDMKEDSLKYFNELLEFLRDEYEASGVNDKDIKKFVGGINVSRKKKVVEFTFSKEWLKGQKLFFSKWEAKDAGKSGEVKSEAKPAPSKDAGKGTAAGTVKSDAKPAPSKDVRKGTGVESKTKTTPVITSWDVIDEEPEEDFIPPKKAKVAIPAAVEAAPAEEVAPAEVAPAAAPAEDDFIITF